MYIDETNYPDDSYYDVPEYGPEEAAEDAWHESLCESSIEDLVIMLQKNEQQIFKLQDEYYDKVRKIKRENKDIYAAIKMHESELQDKIKTLEEELEYEKRRNEGE